MKGEKNSIFTVLLVFITVGVAVLLVVGFRADVKEPIITKSEVLTAQQAWCDALESIARTHREGGDARALAYQILTDAYDYDKGAVFFKPTLTFGPNTFRNSKDAALSYFVGGDPNFPEDTGFALKPWVDVRFVNSGVQIHDNIAVTMGHVFLTDKDGNEIMVEKSWVFREDEYGRLRIINHFSALPFDPTP